MKVSAEITKTGFTEHYISDGVYCRVLHIQAGGFAIGALHKTTHMTVVLTGEVSISIGDEVRRVKAPYFFEALAGSRKVALAHTDTQILNILPTDLKDIEEIEKAMVDTTIPKDLNRLLKPLQLEYKGE